MAVRWNRFFALLPHKCKECGRILWLTFAFRRKCYKWGGMGPSWLVCLCRSCLLDGGRA